MDWVKFTPLACSFADLMAELSYCGLLGDIISIHSTEDWVKTDLFLPSIGSERGI